MRNLNSMKRQIVLIVFTLSVAYGWALDVIFRYDDFRLKDDPVQNALMDVFESEQVALHIAVIPFRPDSIPIIENGLALEHIKNLQKEGVLHIALHGFSHNGNGIDGEFLNLNAAEQSYRLERGTRLLDSVFDTQVHIFIPPWNRYNRTTLDVLSDMGYTIVSSSYTEDQDVSDSRFQYYLAEEIPPYMLKNQIGRMAKWDGLLVCLFHPNDFEDAQAFEDLRLVLQSAKANKAICIRTMDELYAIDQSYGAERIKANFPRPWLSRLLCTNRIVLQPNDAEQIRKYDRYVKIGIVLLLSLICILGVRCKV